jgi:EmrB/QacA subfamily drug resistance transporter
MSDAVPNPAPTETNRWLVLVLVCIAQFMVVLDATITNVALPSIQADLDFSQNSLQWVINGYTLVFGGFLLLGGRASDLFGRRRLFLTGVVIFSFASLANGLAQSGEMLIVFRALQGLGAALVSPAALSIITTTFAEGEERAKALGVWSAIAVSGAAFGLLLGGVLTDLLTWEWIFFVNVPIGIAAFVLSTRYVPESVAPDRPDTVDLPGAVSVTAGLMLLVYAIVEAQNYGWGSARTLGLGAAAVALLVAFVVIELRSSAPLIRMSIFRSRNISGANSIMLLVMGGMFAFFFLVSLYLQQVLDYSPLEAGLAFLPFTAGIIVGAGLSGALARRIPVHYIAIIGMALAVLGLMLLRGAGVDGSYLGNLLPAIIPMSIGMGMTFLPLTLVATTGVSASDAGLASGLFNTSQQVGGALGLAILSTLASDRTANVLADLGRAAGERDRLTALVEGFHLAYLGGVGLIVAGGIVLLLVLRTRDMAAIDPSAQPVAAGA